MIGGFKYYKLSRGPSVPFFHRSFPLLIYNNDHKQQECIIYKGLTLLTIVELVLIFLEEDR